MKRITAIILALIMLILTVPVTAGAAGSWSSWTTDSSKSKDSRYEFQTKTQISTRTKETTKSESETLSGWTRDDSKTTYYFDWEDELYYYDTPQTTYDNFVFIETRQVAIGTKTYLYRYYSPSYNDFSTWQRDSTYIVDGYWVSSYYPYDIYNTGQPLYMSNEIKNIGSDYPCWKGETKTTYKTQYGYRFGRVIYVYYFYRYSNWSEWRDGTGTNSDTTKVRTLYRYRLKDPNLHTVKYNYSKNGGTDATVKSAVVRKGNSISLKPTATKKGWKFLGWNTKANATTALKSLKMGSGNVTLYAIFKKTIKAKFVDYKGQTKTTRTKTAVIYNSTKSASFTPPSQNSLTGWVSKGWASSKKASSKTKNFSISSSKTFYGLYGKKVTLSYSAGKGKTTPKTQSAYKIINSYNTSVKKYPVIKLASSVKHKNENYSFSKWESKNSGKQYSAGAKITLKKNTKMIAKWRLSNYYNLKEETYSFYNFDKCPCGIDGGHCFGMAVTSAGYYLGKLNVKELGINSVKKIFTVSDNSTTRKNICYYQDVGGSFISGSIAAGGSFEKNGYNEYNTNITSDWKQLVDFVSSGKYNNLGKLVINYWGYSKGQDGLDFAGHSVDFLYFKTVDNQKRIYVYDPNCPDYETFFYKDSSGAVKQKPFETLNASISSMSLINIPKFFSLSKKYSAAKTVYAEEGQISISGVKGTPLTGGDGKLMYMYELNENAAVAKIEPLVENAEFVYCGETYSIGDSKADPKTAESKKVAMSAPYAGNCVMFKLAEQPDVSTFSCSY